MAAYPLFDNYSKHTLYRSPVLRRARFGIAFGVHSLTDIAFICVFLYVYVYVYVKKTIYVYDYVDIIVLLNMIVCRYVQKT